MSTVEERLSALETRVADLCEQLSIHERLQRGEFAAIDDKLGDIQKQLAHRLPVWATLLITGMGTLLGAAASAVVMLLSQ